jgi:predicted permease
MMLCRAAVALISSDVDPMFVDLAPDWRLLFFAISLAGVTCALFGLVPALRGTNTPPVDAMRHGGRGLSGNRSQARLRRGLVAMQLALSLVLLAGGLLFGRSLVHLLTVDTGFEQAGVLEADLDLSHANVDDAGVVAVRREVLDRIRSLPSVDSVATASNVPLVGNWYSHVFLERANGEVKGLASFNRVSSDYFQTMRTTIVSGRDFDAHDGAGTPVVAVVNERFAQQYLAGQSAVGATFRLEKEGGPGTLTQVIGVVRNAKYGSLREEYRPVVYLADSQNPHPSLYTNIMIRTSAPFAALRAEVKQAIEGASPEASFHFHDFRHEVRSSLRQDALMATLCGFFALLGTLIAALGVYGVSAYSVSQRTTEIGIRLALGADRARILRLMLTESGWLVGVGLCLGTALALVSLRTVDSMLFGLRPHDPLTLGTAALVLGLVAAAGSYVPARRATRVEPVTALRCDC